MANQLQGHTLHEPIGVIGHIIPWNFPIGMFLMRTSPALAAGCTMFVKPAEQSSFSALYLAHLAKLAGIPDGLINVVTGFGETAGAATRSHMDIDYVSFTGSTEIGRVVIQAAATSNLKAVSLEQCLNSKFYALHEIIFSSTNLYLVFCAMMLLVEVL
nr:aldehyde/histidinol dehydrogenase [Tanacetum cinerariifolium]